MTRTGRTLARLALAAALGLSAAASHAGEGFVTKVRGTGLTIDKGADDGMVVGMPVTIMRSPDDPVIHPITGENLGSPEIEIAEGKITRVSARASSIRLPGPALLPIRPGDVARYTTVDEQMVMEQEMSTETSEKASDERQVIRGEASRLARNIKNIQATIKGLERSIKRLDRFDKDVVQPQFNRINKDIIAIKDELSQLRESVLFLGSVPDIGDMIGEMAGDLSEAEVDRLRELTREVHGPLEAVQAVQAEQKPALPDAGSSPPAEGPPDENGLGDADGGSFFANFSPWILAIVSGIGAAGLAFWFIFTRLGGDEGDDDEEDEEDDELEEDEDLEDDDDDIEIEDEEDDIVVEETT